MENLVTRRAKRQDRQAIAGWPPYPDEFGELDYALRKNGWLDEFLEKENAWIYVTEQDETPIAFSLLAMEGESGAEFRIALHADHLGKGLGRIVAQRTLELGFHVHGLQRIHLVVRRNNHRARNLYESMGFRPCGSCMKEVNGCSVEFQQFEHHAPVNSGRV